MINHAEFHRHWPYLPRQRTHWRQCINDYLNLKQQNTPANHRDLLQHCLKHYRTCHHCKYWANNYKWTPQTPREALNLTTNTTHTCKKCHDKHQKRSA